MITEHGLSIGKVCKDLDLCESARRSDSRIPGTSDQTADIPDGYSGGVQGRPQ